MGLDRHVAGGHQFVNRAAIGDAQQFFTLGVGEYAFEGEGYVQGVFAFLLFTVVAFDLDSDTGQRDVFFFAYIFRVNALQAPRAASK